MCIQCLINYKMIFFIFNGTTVFYTVSEYLKYKQLFFCDKMEVAEGRKGFYEAVKYVLPPVT